MDKVEQESGDESSGPLIRPSPYVVVSSWKEERINSQLLLPLFFLPLFFLPFFFLQFECIRSRTITKDFRRRVSACQVISNETSSQSSSQVDSFMIGLNDWLVTLLMILDTSPSQHSVYWREDISSSVTCFKWSASSIDLHLSLMSFLSHLHPHQNMQLMARGQLRYHCPDLHNKSKLNSFASKATRMMQVLAKWPLLGSKTCPLSKELWVSLSAWMNHEWPFWKSPELVGRRRHHRLWTNDGQIADRTEKVASQVHSSG